MFHRAVSGIKAYNLDPFFLNSLSSHFFAHAEEFSVIEAAMGYYDGIAATETASSYSVALETKTPVVLVLNARGAGASLQAVIEGFVRHRESSQIKGVIFNDANESRYADLNQIAKNAGVRMYGIMPRKRNWSLPSRHLGLLTATEIAGLKEILAELGQQAEQTLDIDGLISLAKTVCPLEGSVRPQQANRVRLAVARDEVFCFMYEENLELLQQLGCDLVFFSPLRDAALPGSISGLYLCGGYPELHAESLSKNASMLRSIRLAIENGLPAIAECGGFLILHETLDGFPMAGVIHGTAYKTQKLQRFGYLTLTACHDNLLCKASEAIRCHEFHFWDSSSPGNGFMAQKAGREIYYPCVHATDTMYAGFPHLYFPSNPSIAERFAEKMIKSDNSRK
jgi:cobyrinic acid a,c-diamide synthase